MGISVTNNLTFYRPPPPQLPADSAELAALAGHVRARRCALFVGAGLSAPAGLPTWGTLMDRVLIEATPWAVDPTLFPDRISMSDPASAALHKPPVEGIRRALGQRSFTTLCRRIQRVTAQPFDLQVLDKALSVVLQDSIDRVELRKLAQDKRYAELAGYCRDRLGRESFDSLVRRLLTPREGIPAIHRDIVRTPFSCVVTTNFDALIEDAYARYGGYGVPRAPTGAELGQQGTLLLDRGFFVLKAHGDAVRPETMIFTADDYRRVIHSNPAFQAVISGILLTHAVLFVGYSLSDTNFRLLLDNHLTIFNGNVPPRYALLSGVGNAESEILWKTAKLQVLTYPEGQHAEVGRCLASLANQFSVVTKAQAISQPMSITTGEHAPSRLYSALIINSDGDRLALELVRHKPGYDAERLWVGGAPCPNTRRLGLWLRAADLAQGQGRDPMVDISRVGAFLERSLPIQLQRELRRFPRRHLIEIACTAGVTRIPWEWLLVNRQPLALSQAVIRRPVEITHQARGRRVVNRPLRALVIGDAGGADCRGDARLHFADLEAKAIEILLRTQSRATKVTRLSRQAATHERLLTELDAGDYDVIHFGGHAWFDDREAYFYLWDRIMLGSELAPLLNRRPPALMVLDTHYTAFVLAEVDALVRELVGSPARSTETPPSSGSRGFADAAMRCGVTSFVGAFGDVGDQSGAEVTVAFFAELTTGVTVAEALRAARARTAKATRRAGMFYTAFGYPDFLLCTPTSGVRTSHDVTRILANVKARCGWSDAAAATR